MKNKINIYLIEYAINSLLREKSKNIFIFIIFTLLVFLLSSLFFVTNSIKYQLNSTILAMPDIIVQNIKAGRVSEIDVKYADEILSITGVKNTQSRVWGYYYFTYANVNFSLIGINQFEDQYKNSFTKLVEDYNFDDKRFIVVGQGVRDILDKNYYKNYFNFIKPNGEVKKMDIAGTFLGDTSLESNDVIVMSQENLRDIFEINDSKATDIAVIVSNQNELDTIATKIKLKYPNLRVITKTDLKVSYLNIFDYKSGIFLVFFIISIFTFFIVIYDKASGVSSQEKREIGILKAIGWKIEDILIEKFYEAFILSFFAYFIGIVFAMGYVYIFDAPLLSDIFIGYSDLKPKFELPFVVDFQNLFLVFLLSVPIYISAIIIPSWKIATLDAEEIIR